MTLFKRVATLTVDTIQITGLRFTFKIIKNLQPTPNKSEIKIYNLNDNHRSQLEKLDKAPVQLDAGYEGQVSTVFLGNMRSALTAQQGPDIITTLGAGDGEDALAYARVKKTLPKGVRSGDVLMAASQSLTAAINGLGASQPPIGLGNVAQAINNLPVALQNLWPNGTALTGAAVHEMTAVCKSLGLEWSVQSGKLQVLPITTALSNTAVLLSDATGLIGSPSLDAKGGKRYVTAKTLMVPNLDPGRIFVLKAKFIQGQFRVEEATHNGDTHGTGEGSWSVDVKGTAY